MIQKLAKLFGSFKDDYTGGLLSSLDIGLKMLKSGQQIVINPLVEFEVKGLRESDKNPEQEIQFKNEWKQEMEKGDRFFSPNLSKTNPGLSINIK